MVVERTNSWHDLFRKMFTRYEHIGENYPSWVQQSCRIIIDRKIILVYNPSINYKKIHVCELCNKMPSQRTLDFYNV